MSVSRATVLFCALFAAALASAVLVVASRSPNLVLEAAKLPDVFTPNGDGIRDNAEIVFFVREADESASVHIVGRDLEPTRTLDEQVALAEGETVTYLWDGMTDAGAPAPAGRYRLRVVLPSRDRDMIFPNRINLLRPPPREQARAG